MPGIWAEGPEAYQKALRDEYESARRRLQDRLGQCDEPLKRDALMEELAELKRTFEKRLKAIKRSLFGARSVPGAPA